MIVHVLTLENDHDGYSVLGVFSNEAKAVMFISQREQENISVESLTLRNDRRLAKSLWRGNNLYWIIQCQLEL